MTLRCGKEESKREVGEQGSMALDLNGRIVGFR